MAEGLQRAARTAERSKYPNTPEPAVQQVWEDMDQCRTSVREVTILSFTEKTRRVWRRAKGTDRGHYEDVPYRVAICSVTIGGEKRRGTVQIDLKRFVPKKSGFRYLRTEKTS